MGGNEIITASAVFMLLVLIVGYFLKGVRNSIEENIRQTQKDLDALENRQTVSEQDIKSIRGDMSNSIRHIEATIDLKFKNVTDKLELIFIELRKKNSENG